MHLIYFDENKYCKDNPFFTIGGIQAPEAEVPELDNTRFGPEPASREVARRPSLQDMGKAKGQCRSGSSAQPLRFGTTSPQGLSRLLEQPSGRIGMWRLRVGDARVMSRD